MRSIHMFIRWDIGYLTYFTVSLSSLICLHHIVVLDTDQVEQSFLLLGQKFGVCVWELLDNQRKRSCLLSRPVPITPAKWKWHVTPPENDELTFGTKKDDNIFFICQTSLRMKNHEVFMKCIMNHWAVFFSLLKYMS